MLVLTRKHGQKVHIGDDVVVTVFKMPNGKIRLGIDAPEDTNIVRGELLEEEQEAA